MDAAISLQSNRVFYPLKSVISEDATQVGMSNEKHTKHIIRFPLIPSISTVNLRGLPIGATKD